MRDASLRYGIALGFLCVVSSSSRRAFEEAAPGSYIEKIDYTARCGDTRKIPYAARRAQEEPLPEAEIPDRCEGSHSLGDHLLITTTYTYPTAWMQKDISIPHFVYFAGEGNETHRHENAGLEAMGYLTFMAEYYNCLPKVAMFVHPHRDSYHSYRSLDLAVKLVQWKNVPGYATVHQNGANWAQFDPYHPLSNLGQELSMEQQQSEEVPCNQIFNNTAYEYWPSWEYRRSQFVSKAWDLFFGRTELGEMPAKLRMPLVAEFYARKERIQLRSRKFYLQAIRWVLDVRKADEFTDWETSVTFELLWHYIFGEPAFLPGLTVKPCDLYKCDGLDEA